MAFPAFLDTCAMVSSRLVDVLLRLPDFDHSYRPLWSEHVLVELERTLVHKIDLTREKAAKRVDAMRRYFPDAVVTGYEALIPQMQCDEKDRHVLAAAIVGRAAIIVTFNLRDFPAEALEPYDLGAVHPDEFLLDQLDLYPDATVQAVLQAALDRQQPPESVTWFLDQLAKLVPKFAEEVRRRLSP